MKKRLQFITLLATVAMVLASPVGAAAQPQTDKAEDSGITIKNTTAFPLKNVSVVYNQEEKDEINEIAPGETEVLELPETDRIITEIKISGKLAGKQAFSGSFNGLIDNDTLLTIDQDEDFAVCVSSNLETL